MKFVLSFVLLVLAVGSQASVVPLVPGGVVGISPYGLGVSGATLGDIHGRLDDIHGAWDDVHGALDAARGNSAGLPVYGGWPIAYAGHHGVVQVAGGVPLIHAI